jgi:SAM-dependent methyltransferase
MTQAEMWDDEAARDYDTPGEGMFAPDLLEATVALLAAYAGDGAALELAVGTGRVALPLQEAGVPVAGIELSEAMAARLLEKDPGFAVTVGDMASTRVPGEFALVYLVFNTLGNLLTQDEQVVCFVNAAAHLRPGGRFVVEMGVPDLRALPPGRTAAVFEDSAGYLGVDSYDTVRQLLVSQHVTFDPRRGREARIGRTPHRYVWPAEMDLMARLAGLTLESRYADWSRAPFAHESRSHVSTYVLGGVGARS